MSTTLDDGWDRSFLDLSSKLAEPLCWTWGLGYRVIAPLGPDKFDNFASKVDEVAARVLIVLTTILALTVFSIPILFTAALLGIGSKICRTIGFSLQKNGYTHVRGSAPEKALDQDAKIMTWNVCGIGGGLHYDHGGVIHWRSRLDGIVDTILKEDPDVLVLQEIYDTALAEAIIERLRTHYAHFYTHLGANIMGSVSGEMVLTKCAVARFSNTSFANNDWTLNRTFTTLDIKARPEDAAPCARIVGTHLIHDDNAKRMVQVAQIVNTLAKETLALPTVLAGDLNLERDKADEGQILNQHMTHGYLGPEPTCTNELVRQWNPKIRSVPNETIDYISLLLNHQGNAHLLNTRLVKAHDNTYNTKTALSDHHALVSTLRFRHLLPLARQ